MSNFDWPHWVIFIGSVIAGLNACIGAVRNQKLSSIGVTLMVLAIVAGTLGYWAILSAGGFW